MANPGPTKIRAPKATKGKGEVSGGQSLGLGLEVPDLDLGLLPRVSGFPSVKPKEASCATGYPHRSFIHMFQYF